MNKMKSLLAAALVSLVIHSAQAGVKEIGVVNGVHIVRVKTLGVFVPSSVTLVSYDPTKPGEIEVLSHAGGAGVVPSVATAGGVVGGAALLRPPSNKTNVKNEGNANANQNAYAAGGTGGAGVISGVIQVNPAGPGGGAGGGSPAGCPPIQHVPPGHINNPSGNH